MIVNQSIIVRIPQHSKVNSFKIPIPISPSINLSTPNKPKNHENKKHYCRFLSSVACNDKNVVSSAFSSFCLMIGIALDSKYFTLEVKYKSIFFTYPFSLLLPPNYTSTPWCYFVKIISTINIHQLSWFFLCGQALLPEHRLKSLHFMQSVPASCTISC